MDFDEMTLDTQRIMNELDLFEPSSMVVTCSSARQLLPFSSSETCYRPDVTENEWPRQLSKGDVFQHHRDVDLFGQQEEKQVDIQERVRQFAQTSAHPYGSRNRVNWTQQELKRPTGVVPVNQHQSESIGAPGKTNGSRIIFNSISKIRLSNLQSDAPKISERRFRSSGLDCNSQPGSSGRNIATPSHDQFGSHRSSFVPPGSVYNNFHDGGDKMSYNASESIASNTSSSAYSSYSSGGYDQHSSTLTPPVPKSSIIEQPEYDPKIKSESNDQSIPKNISAFRKPVKPYFDDPTVVDQQFFDGRYSPNLYTSGSHFGNQNSKFSAIHTTSGYRIAEENDNLMIVPAPSSSSSYVGRRSTKQVENRDRQAIKPSSSSHFPAYHNRFYNRGHSAKLKAHRTQSEPLISPRRTESPVNDKFGDVAACGRAEIGTDTGGLLRVRADSGPVVGSNVRAGVSNADEKYFQDIFDRFEKDYEEITAISPTRSASSKRCLQVEKSSKNHSADQEIDKSATLVEETLPNYQFLRRVSLDSQIVIPPTYSEQSKQHLNCGFVDFNRGLSNKTESASALLDYEKGGDCYDSVPVECSAVNATVFPHRHAESSSELSRPFGGNLIRDAEFRLGCDGPRRNGTSLSCGSESTVNHTDFNNKISDSNMMQIKSPIAPDSGLNSVASSTLNSSFSPTKGDDQCRIKNHTGKVYDCQNIHVQQPESDHHYYHPRSLSSVDTFAQTSRPNHINLTNNGLRGCGTTFYDDLPMIPTQDQHPTPIFGSRDRHLVPPSNDRDIWVAQPRTLRRDVIVDRIPQSEMAMSPHRYPTKLPNSFTEPSLSTTSHQQMVGTREAPMRSDSYRRFAAMSPKLEEEKFLPPQSTIGLTSPELKLSKAAAVPSQHRIRSSPDDRSHRKYINDIRISDNYDSLHHDPSRQSSDSQSRSSLDSSVLSRSTLNSYGGDSSSFPTLEQHDVHSRKMPSELSPCGPNFSGNSSGGLSVRPMSPLMRPVNGRRPSYTEIRQKIKQQDKPESYSGTSKPGKYGDKNGPNRLPISAESAHVSLENNDYGALVSNAQPIPHNVVASSVVRSAPLSIAAAAAAEQAQAQIDALTRQIELKMERNQNYFGVCSGCGGGIVNQKEACQAQNKLYHSKCFRCSLCECSLRDKAFYDVAGKIYCEQDYMYCGYQDTVDRCGVCRHPIIDMILQAVGKSFHPSCFKCSACRVCLDGVPFTVDHHGVIFCVGCYHKAYAPYCARCQKPITPVAGTDETVRVVSMEHDYHIDCYTCEGCGLQLTDEPHRRCFPLDGHLLCQRCHMHWARTGGGDALISDV